MSEYDEQVAVVEWCDLHGVACIHVPNEGKRAKATAGRLKRAGMRPGVPDLFIPEPRGGYHGMWLELKDVDGRPPTKAQREWLELLDAKGYVAAWAKGADTAIEMIQRYLAL